MRFNSPAHLDLWQETGQFPAIHANIVAMAKSKLANHRGLDLCCSHGLLGTQLVEIGFDMLGIDDDNTAVTKARYANIPMPIHKFKVTKTNFDRFKSVAAMHKTEFIVARRCLPELFGEDLEFGRYFFKTMRELWVHEIILEGRVKTPNATNQLSSIEREIELLSPYYSLHTKQGNVAYLRSNESL
jgi:hypothetical protein